MEPALKTFTNRVARAALSEGADELIYLLQQVGLVAPCSTRTIPDTAQEGQPPCENRVGIWERDAASGSAAFVRTAESRSEWPFWANLKRIEPKGTRRRVVFLGESAARGWGYLPPHTPAEVLESLLQTALGGSSGIEVIDLARVNMALEVRELAVSAAALEPDLVVLFAGNNWRPRTPVFGEDLCELDAVASSEGAAGIKRLYEEQLSAAAGQVVTDVSEFYAARNIPVIWIVPEWNLADWHEWQSNAPMLGGAANRQWIECAQNAQAALNREQYAEAAGFAQRMIELDGGTAAYGFRVLAHCKREQGEIAEARRLLEAARDARIWSSSNRSAPRPYGVTQNAIRAAAARAGSHVVDLPRVLAEHTHGAIPDRRLFLDYCHLTSEGIRIAMSAAASCVIELIAGKPVDTKPLLAQIAMPDNKARANAELKAAIHNAHWWQTEEVVSYHCGRAITLWPDIAQLMTAFVDLQTTCAPTQLSSAAERMTLLEQTAAKYYILGNSPQLLDAILLNSIADALESGGESVRGRIVRQWQERNDLAREPADLLSFYYLSASAQIEEIAWAIPPELDRNRFNRADYYRAYWVESKFPFVARREQQVMLTMTLRLPAGASKAEAVHLAVNGHEIGVIDAQPRWSTVHVSVPAHVVQDGVNTLTVEWPMPPDSPLRGAAERAIRKMTRGDHDALLQVFGEIHRLTASAEN